MRIEHIAIWTDNLERLKDFYITYFGAVSNQKYTNKNTHFESYFLSFDQGCRIEIMRKPEILKTPEDNSNIGLAHLAVSVGSKENVLALTARLHSDGYHVLSEPRTTGDGYFESVISDPDGNRIEITI